MKYIYTLLVTIVVFSAGCKKTEDIPEVPKNQQITIKAFDKQRFDLNINTDQGYVNLNIEDLPENVFNDDVTPIWGTTPFTTQLTITSKQAVSGNYPIKIVSYKDGQTDSFKITHVDLVIEPMSSNDCADFFKKINTGNNAGAYILDSSETRAFAAQPKISEVDGKLVFTNLILSYYFDSKISVSKQSGADQVIPFTIACETGIIEIPSTTVTDVDGKSYTVGGTGSVDYKTQNYTIQYTSGSQIMNLKGSLDLDQYYAD